MALADLVDLGLDGLGLGVLGQGLEFAQQIRDYPKAVDYLDRAIGLAPDEQWPYFIKAQTVVLWKADVVEARRICESVATRGEFQSLFVLNMAEILRLDRDYGAIVVLLDQTLSEWHEHQFIAYPRSLMSAEAHALNGDAERARVDYEMARTEIEEALADRPDDYRLHASLGLALAGLGRKEQAVAAGRKAVEMMPFDKDAYIGQQYMADLALIYARLGEVDKALPQIDRVLSIPTKFSVAMLEADPRWDGLRDHPRYREIIEKHS